MSDMWDMWNMWDMWDMWTVCLLEFVRNAVTFFTSTAAVVLHFVTAWFVSRM